MKDATTKILKNLNLNFPLSPSPSLSHLSLRSLSILYVALVFAPSLLLLSIITIAVAITVIITIQERKLCSMCDVINIPLRASRSATINLLVDFCPLIEDAYVRLFGA